MAPYLFYLILLIIHTYILYSVDFVYVHIKWLLYWSDTVDNCLEIPSKWHALFRLGYTESGETVFEQGFMKC